MSDSSDEEQSNIDVPYSSRPEWADIKPIDQDEETNDIVRIAYTESFKEVFGYFRAILKVNEKSERAFELSTDAALLNPANYTVWYFRRLLLRELKKDLKEELHFMDNVIRSNPKNYQVWQHRRSVVEWLQDASHEILFTKMILEKDSKNYHAWQYRQWVVKTFRLWEFELEYVDRLLDMDVRNNSAWNQRYFYFNNQCNLNSAESIQIVEKELDFCLDKLSKCFDNESVWNYMKALIKHLSEAAHSPEEKSLYARWMEKLVSLCAANMEDPREENRSPFAMAFLVDNNVEKIEATIGDQDAESILKEETKLTAVRDLLAKSLQILELLANQYDCIRKNYWLYLSATYKQTYKTFLQ